MDYEVTVIGGGPGGYVAAIKAAQLGKKTCIIEKEFFGGTCLNVGCIPTKVLLKSVDMLEQLKSAEDFGISGISPADVHIDFDLLQKRKNRIVKSLVGGVEGLLKKNGVKVYKGSGAFVDPHTVLIGGEKISSDNIIIATGSKPKMLPLENPDNMPLYTSTDILNMRIFPKSIAIIGGGVVGVELAHYLSGIGVKVKIIEFLDRILPMVDKDITDKVAEKLQKSGVEIFTSAKAGRITKNGISMEKDGKVSMVDCEAVLMSVGRDANIEGLCVENIGLSTDKGHIVTDDMLKTNIGHIYAVGDVNGKMMLAHTASMEGIIAVENICGEERKMRYDTIPSCIYITPEIASVGLTEEDARSKYGDVKVGVFPMRANGKAKIEGEESGSIKIITEKRYNEIIGAHMHCPHATDMIAEMVLAMNLECTTDELVYTVHPHPTISEAVHEACHAAFSKAIHF